MAITNAGQLVSAEQFTNFYFEQLKIELESSDLSISKVGLVGLMLHIMGNLQYDTKQYYDGLFKESFPVSSNNDSNLAQHSVLFNYHNKLANAAQINGTLQLDFANLPQRLATVVKRELILNNISFYVGTLSYNLLSKNKITIDTINNIDYYRIETIDKLNNQTIQPVSPQYSEVSLINCEQVDFEEFIYNIPNYPFETYYQIEIELTDLFINDLIINVKEYNALTAISYNISQNKTFEAATTNVIFYSLFVRNGINMLLLELGSGKHGKYIPNSELTVKIVKTKGALGNIGAQSVLDGFKGNIQLRDYNSSGVIVHSLSNLIDPNSFIRVNIIEAISGKDPFIGNTLRLNLIKFIQSRDNLLNELDYRNILSKYFKYFDFIFKKVNFQDNIIGVYVSFLNRLRLPEYTTTASISTTQFTASIIEDKYVYAPEYTIDGVDFVSPFLYIYDSLLCIYKACLIFPELTFNPTHISNINSQSAQLDPLINLKFTFDSAAISTKIELIKVIEPQNTSVNYKLTIPLLGLYNVDINNGFYIYESIIIEDLLIYLYIEDLVGVILYELKFDNIGLIIDYGDFLHLKTYNNYIIDVPLIHKDNYLNDQLFYLNRFKTQLGSLNLTETRLTSDDIQLKFLNTFYLTQNYTKQLTVQNYEINIKFPLVVKIHLILQKKVVISTNLDVQSAILNLTRTISTYLDSLNSSQFKFYKTVLIDMAQSLPWVKHVAVTLKDSDGISIPDFNIETKSQQDFISNLSKADVLAFTPTLFWIDINQLVIDYEFSGD